MNTDVIGRVNNINLPQTHGILPVFEAIINSMQSLEEDKKNNNPYIKIIINRDEEQQELMDDNQYFLPIKNIKIIDNGLGFNEINYTAFKTSDTTQKLHLGGKGIGRFLWLKAFDSVEINSIYLENGKYYKRHLDFLLNLEGTANESLQEIEKEVPITTVTLKGFKEIYKKYAPKKIDTIAFRILEHLLSFFIYSQMPAISIEDSINNEKVSINSLYNNEIKPNIKNAEFSIKDNKFTVTNIKLYSSMETLHKVFYCAHGRAVKNEHIKDILQILQQKITDYNGETFVILCFIASKILDDTVNQERTNFNLPNIIAVDDLHYEEQLTFQDLKNEIAKIINLHFDEYILPIKKQQKQRIEKFVNEENPEYKPILKYKSDKMTTIPPNIDDKKLEIELHKINQEIELEIKEESQDWINKDDGDIKNIDEYKKKYDFFLEKLNDFGMSRLTEYIIHRRLVLDFFKKRLSQNKAGKYNIEESVHELIFPLRENSDNINYYRQNLWLIDEKLAYHYYLASDTKLSSNPITDSVSDQRPDLLIFNNRFAFVEDELPYSSVVIIEFKRPMRTQYSKDENPIDQVLDYIRLIRDGKAIDKNGRPFNVRPTTPFYGYIICDLTQKIKRYAENGGYILTPDGEGFFNFNTNYNAYIEIISFDKLLRDAQKRNRVLFEKLGLSNKTFITTEI